MQKIKKYQMEVTFVAGLLAIAHIIWPNVAIDTITLALFIIAIIPWLVPMIKSFELPSGYKIELKDLETASNKVEKAGLLSKEVELIDLNYYTPQLCCGWVCRRNF